MDLAYIIGLGRTKAGEHWDQGLVDLAVEAGVSSVTRNSCGLAHGRLGRVGCGVGGRPARRFASSRVVSHRPTLFLGS